MKIVVDYQRCIKSGECYYNHPDLFQVGEDGYPVVQVESLDTPQQRDEAQQAVEVCPAEAIATED